MHAVRCRAGKRSVPSMRRDAHPAAQAHARRVLQGKQVLCKGVTFFVQRQRLAVCG
jgi:hypothetical protein